MSRSAVLGLVLAAATAGLFTLGGCPQGVVSALSTTESIGPDGGRLELTDPSSQRQGAFLNVPAGALATSTNLTLAALFRTDLTLDGSSPPRSLIGLTPSGLRFNNSVQVGLPMPSGSDPNALVLYFFDAADATWVPLSSQTIDAAAGLIMGRTNHFTLYALGAKPPVDFAVQLYYSDNQLSAGLRVVTPLEDIAIRSQSASTYNAASMRDILAADPAALRPRFTVTLSQSRVNAPDQTVDTKIIQYQVSELFGDTGLPETVAVKVDNEPVSGTFNVDGELDQALSEVEQLFTGEPILFTFDGFVPGTQTDYYVTVRLDYLDGTGLNHNPEPFRTQPNDGRAFELNTKSILVKPANLTSPPDADGDGIVDSFEDFGAVSTRPVLAPVFLPADGATTFTGTLNVIIGCQTPGSVIYYTTDGSTPSATNGTQLSCYSSVTLLQTTTLRAVAVIDGRPTSEVTSQLFTRTGG